MDQILSELFEVLLEDEEIEATLGLVYTLDTCCSCSKF
jgi:hypothetical protein